MEDSHGCCDGQQCWLSESIIVSNGEATIDIAPALVDKNDQYASIRRGQASLRVVFSTTVYPPVWDQRKKIEDAIVLAAAEANIPLIRTASHHIDSKHPHYVSILGCKFSRPYTHNKKRMDLPIAGENDDPRYREGVRQDPIVGKKNRNRVDGKKKPRRTVTTKLAPDALCKFHIRLCLYPGQCWCIEPWTGNREHRNHPRLNWEEMRRPMASLPVADSDNAALYSRFTSTGSARSILFEQTKCTMSDGQMRYNQNKVEIINGTIPRLDGDIHDGVSNGANDLISHMQVEQKHGELSFVAIYHEISATSFVAVKKADEKRNRARQESRIEDTALQMAEIEYRNEVSVVTHCIDASGETTAEKFHLTNDEQYQLGASLSTIRDRLKVGQKILLAVAWVRTDERRLFQLFPEILMVDVTHGTNSETRPLCVSASIDANMKTFTPIRAFLPSECQWVFHWLWASAIPSLLGIETIRRIQLVLSDGDPKIYVPFDSVRERLYPSAVHGLCSFHLVTQPLQRLHLQGRDKPQVKRMIETYVHDCAYSFELYSRSHLF